MTFLSLFRKTKDTFYALIFQSNKRTLVVLLNTLPSNIIHELPDCSEQVKHRGKKTHNKSKRKKELTKLKLSCTLHPLTLQSEYLPSLKKQQAKKSLVIIWLISHACFPFHGRMWKSICALVAAPIKSLFTANLCVC